MDHARKLKFSSYVHLPSINQTFQYCHVRMILCNLGEVYSFENGICISALDLARVLILNNDVLLASINRIYKYYYTMIL